MSISQRCLLRSFSFLVFGFLVSETETKPKRNRNGTETKPERNRNLAHRQAVPVSRRGPEARGASGRDQAARRGAQGAPREAGHRAGRLPADYVGWCEPSREAGGWVDERESERKKMKNEE